MNHKYLLVGIVGVVILGVFGAVLYFGSGFQGAEGTPTPSGDLVTGNEFPRTSDVPAPSGSGRETGSGDPFPSSSPTTTQAASQEPSRIFDNASYLARIPGTSRFVATSRSGELFIGDGSGVFTKQEGTLIPGAFAVSPDGLKILKKRIEGQTVTYVVSDLGAKKEYVLGNEDAVRTPVFSHDSKKLYFQYYDSVKQIRYLASSNLNFSGMKQVAALNFLDMNMMRLGKDKLLFVPKPSGYVHGTAYSFSLKDLKLTKLFSGYGISAFSNETGTRVIYSSTESGGRNITLNMYDVAKNTNKSLGLRTFAEKCALGGTTLLCALPTQFDSTLVYPDSYYQEIFNSLDNLVAVNPETAAVERFISGTPLHDTSISTVALTADGTAAFFINTRDHGLYKLEL